MGMEDEVGWLATVAADKSKREGIEDVPAVVPEAYTSRESHSGAENRQTKAEAEFWYSGKEVHKESECWKKRVDSEKTGSGSGRIEQGNRERLHYAKGFERVGKGPAFVMRHEAYSMKKTTPKSEEVWYVHSGASNHMTSHEEWFSYLEKPEQPGVVET